MPRVPLRCATLPPAILLIVCLAACATVLGVPVAHGQEVTGQVTDARTNEPLPGANVAVQGTTTGTSTDSLGRYRIQVPAARDTLVFSFIGYESRVEAVAGRSSIDVALAPMVGQMEGIVVVGYGTQEAEDVTGSISSVDGTAFANEPVTDASTALQGRAPGVEVVRNGGAPGSGGSIRIRGTGTVNSAGPLVVIDGVPGGSLSDLDPQDIASIEVLKDASAAAIYGNRAANGVILVSTNRGRYNQDLTVDVSSSVGRSTPINTIDMLEAPEVAELKRERYVNDGLEVNPIWQVDSLHRQRTNWQDALMGTGSVQKFNMSIRGGSERSAFSISAGIFNEDGMIESSFFERYSLRVNSDHRIGRVLDIKQNLQLTRARENFLNTLSAQSGVIWSAIRFHPGFPVRWPDGDYSSSQLSSEFGDINNPIFTINTEDEVTTRNRLLGNVEGELDLIGGLSLRANAGLEYTASDYYDFDVVIDGQIRANSRNDLERRFNEAYSLLGEVSLNYDAQFADVHDVDLLAGYSQQTFETDFYSAQRLDFTDESPSQRVLTSGSTIAGADGNRTDDGLQSVFGRVNYAFADKYLLTASFRADGSSRFAEANRWGYFPAASVGWRIAEEPLLQRLLPSVSTLKLSAGWGRSGNQSVARLQYLALFQRGARYSFGGNEVVGANQVRIANKDISWEVAEMTNVGLDIGLFNDRLTAKAEYFVKDTEDMLLAPPTIGTVGTASIPDVNVGEVRNQGLELALGYNTGVGPVDLSLSGNASFIENEVRSLNEEFLGSRRYGRPNAEIARTFEGEPIATFYGWRTDGLYQRQEEIDTDPFLANDPRKADIRPGDVRFIDLTGDGRIDGDDREIIGDPHPDMTYGVTLQARYSGFDLTMFFLGAVGADIYNADRMQGLDPTFPFNMYEETLGRWRGEGTSNSIPRMTTRRNNLNHRTSDLFVESGDFVRMKTLTLGYAVPTRWTQQIGLDNARLYITGQNVLTLTGYSGLDPEIGYTDGNLQRNVDFARYPQPRTWTIGTSITL